MTQAALAPRHDAEDDARPQSVAGAVRRVLVVDDSVAHRRLMGTILKRWGYDVLEAASGADALQVLRSESVDLVLSDWIMPGMSGIDLCRTYRAEQGEGYVYLILLTSKSGGEDVATGLAAGADDFLSKPIDSNELRARIAAGERLIAMQRAVVEKNRQLGDALDALQYAHDVIARDLTEARRLQQSLVPHRDRTYPGAEVSLLLRPCGHVGGDLVGAFQVNDTRLGIYSIDVSGHGIASALMTARIAGYLSGTSPERNLALVACPDGVDMRPPAEICERLNRMLIEDMDTELYFTMSIASVDLVSGQCSVAQAGHPHPLILRRDGTTEWLEENGMPVGLIPGASFGTLDVTLCPGDRLFLHSDGFTEAVSPDGTMLEHDGLGRLLTRLDTARGSDLLDALVWSLSDYCGDAEFDDDLSGVMLDFTGR